MERSTWVLVHQGQGQFAAWLRRLRELPNVNIGTGSEFVDGAYKATLLVPTKWPPAKGATGPPQAA